ncbi:DUF4376 domain-containing protein [Aeromonas sanarellii]
MFYSALKNTWFSPSSRSAYEATNSWPDDAVEYPSDVFDTIVCRRPDGMNMVPDEKGHPTLIEQPKPVITKEGLIAAVADKRWLVETSGIVVAGSPIKTDRESQAQLSSAYTLLKSGLIPDTPWKTADGTFVRVTLAQIEPITQAVAAHVRACFAAEEVHSQAIAALQTPSELDAYDIDTGWPKGQ